MINKKGSISKRRGSVGKVLLTTTLAGTAATSAMAQSTTTSAGLMSFLKNTKTKVNNSITNVKEKVLTNALIKTVISAMWPKTVLKKLKGVGEHSWNKFSGNAKYQNKKEIINDKSEKLTVVEEGGKNIEGNNVKKIFEENNSLKPEENNNHVNDVHTIENNTNREVIRKDDLPKTEENHDNDKVNEGKEFSKTFNESQLEMSNIVNENVNSDKEFLNFSKADRNNNVKDDKPKSDTSLVDNDSSKGSSSLKKNNIENIEDIEDIDDIFGIPLDDTTKKQIYKDTEKFEKVIKDLDKIYYEKNKHTEQNSKNEGSKEFSYIPKADHNNRNNISSEYSSIVADDSKEVDEEAEKYNNLFKMNEGEKFKNEYINNSEEKNKSLTNMNGDEQNDLTLFGSSLLNDFEESNTEDLNIAPGIYNIDEGDEEPPANDDIEGYKDPRIDIGSPNLSGILLDSNNENYDEDKEEVIIGVLNNINEILTAAKEEEKNNSNTIKEGTKNDNLLIKESYDKDRSAKKNSNVKEMANPNLSIEKEKNKDKAVEESFKNKNTSNKNDDKPDKGVNGNIHSDFSREFDKDSLILSNIINADVVPPNYELHKNISANEKNYDVNDEKNFEKNKKDKNTIDKKTEVNLDSTLKSEDDLDESGNWLENSNILMTDENGNSIPAIKKNDEYHGNYHKLFNDSFDDKADFNKYDDELDIASEELNDDFGLDLEDVLDKMDEDENNSNEKLKENLINENRKKDDLNNKIENHFEKTEGNIENTEEKNVEDKNDFGSQDTMYKKVKSLVVKSAVGMIGIAGSLLVGSARTFGSWFF